MPIVNFLSGSTNNRTQVEAAELTNTFNGVAGGPVETLNIQLDPNGILLLEGQTARFNNLALKILGSVGNDTYTGTENAETISGLAGNDKLSGNGGNDTLDGGAGNDTLDGGAGNDKMTGGAGNDTFVVDSATDTVTEAANGGTDTVQSSINFTLGANLENLTLTGDDDINGTGNTLANRIIGNDGNNSLNGGAGNDVLMGGDGDDTLDGGLGNDVMFGGAGDDTYVVNSTSDKVTELFDDGIDTVNSSISYKLGSNVENLTLTGAAVINGTGNGLDNEIIGNAKANILTGDAGNDTLEGGAGNDSLIGGAGNDSLDGGTGNDSMVGGIGNDTYVIDSISDKVVENAGEGTDTIVTGLNFALADNFENLTLTGENDVNGDGNDLDNVIIGNDGNNVLDGGAGNDNLSGGEGDDILLGGDGNDTLDGGDGDDILSGGDGDNIFYVDEGDIIVGGSNGIDDVFSSGSFTLADGLDNLTLTGEDDIDGTGNDLDNVITGNEGNNVLDGGDGDDIIDGGEGDDTFLISEGEDVLTGGEGSDTFVIDASEIDDTEIDGGVDDEDVGDQQVNTVFFTGTSISTAASTLGTVNALDVIQFNQSGDFTNLAFTNIEQVHLASGVSITLSADAVTEAFDSLEVESTGINPGVHFYGVAGGATETVTVAGDYEDTVFTPAATIVGATPITYSRADFQLDDASIGDLFHNVTLVQDFQTGSAATAHGRATYAREDGSNSSETIQGNEGVDNADGRLGDDIINGNGGNDLLKGQGGADTINGGDGNDFFLISGFETGILGAYGKADDGHAEWIATGATHDVIIGGAGIDTLRITAGSDTVAHGTIVLNDDNFQGMERVEVGALVGRVNVENSDLQLINDHYYLNAGGTVSNSTTVLTGGTVVKNLNLITVDASGITDTDSNATTGGLTFVGNGNVNTFIGTQNNDTFIGNGGNDVLTGGAGDDTFQFGKVHTQTVTGAATTVQTYTDVATSLTGTDTITDFSSGTDHITLDHLQYTNLTGITDVTDNLVQGAGAVAADANDFLVFDSTSGTLYYDADANGAGAAVAIATLTGVASVAAADFHVF